MGDHLSEIAMTLATPLIVGLFGFLWRVNSKLTALEKTVEASDRRITSNAHQLRTHFEKAFTIRKDTQ